MGLKVSSRLSIGQSFALDVMRYTAAMLVALHHGIAYYYRDFYRPISGASVFTDLGSIGVAGFFMMSGFLIAYTVVRKREDDPAYGLERYSIERIVRIYIVFLPAMLLAVVVNLTNLVWIKDTVPNMHLFTAHNFAVTIGMMSGIPGFAGHSEIMPFIGPAWSINYEFWFYMLFGAAVLPLAAADPSASWIVRVLTLALVFWLVSQLASFKTLGLMWLSGALIGFAFSRGWLSSMPRAICAGILFAAVFALWPTAGNDEEMLLLGFLGALLVLVLGVFRLVSPARTSRAVAARLAGFSYSLYLTHIMVIWAVRHFGYTAGLYHFPTNDGRKLTFFVISIILANVAAYGFAKATEDNTNVIRRMAFRILSRDRLRRVSPEPI